jgi:hypothetical protein
MCPASLNKESPRAVGAASDGRGPLLLSLAGRAAALGEANGGGLASALSGAG